MDPARMRFIAVRRSMSGTNASSFADIFMPLDAALVVAGVFGCGCVLWGCHEVCVRLDRAGCFLQHTVVVVFLEA